jgi:beta-lactamase regulating signal transducer with metallopeptidase domain
MSIHVVTDTLIHYGGLALLHGTVLALLTWVLSATLLRRSRPAVQAILWTVVLLKFLLPPALPGEMALSNWIARAAKGAAITSTASFESSKRPINGQPIAGFAQDTPAPSLWNLFVWLLLGCYSLIVILLSLRALLSLRRTRRRIGALPFADEGTREEVLTLAARIGLKRPPEVRDSSEDMTPYVLGFRLPVLVLPERLMPMLEPSQRQALILHELAHIRRQDQLIRWLQSLACILFFFFPPVRWVCRRVEHFTEMACDRWAVAVSGVEPQTYARCLVRVVKEMRLRQQAPQAGLSLVRRARLLEERLRTVLMDDAMRSPRLSTGAKVMLIGWSFFVLAGGSATQAHKEIPDLPQLSASKVEDRSSQSPWIRTEEAQTTGTRVHLKRVADKIGATSKQPDVVRLSEHYHIESGENSFQEERNSENPDRFRDERMAAERSAIEARAQACEPPSGNKAPSSYEEGFLLGKRFAEERAKYSQVDAVTDKNTKRNQPSFDEEARREIEMRMQKVTTQPPRR